MDEYTIKKNDFLCECENYLKQLSHEDFEEYREKCKIRLDQGLGNNQLNLWINLACYDEYDRRHPPKKPLKNKKRAVWITIQDWQRRKKDIPDLKIFLDRMKYRYYKMKWVIEIGSSENIHIHMLVILKNAKNHKRDLRMEWSKLFDTDVGGKNDFYLMKKWSESDKMPPYDQWVQEKIDYMENGKKGEHKNVEDIQCGGGEW